jgi:hypothetical protein
MINRNKYDHSAPSQTLRIKLKTNWWSVVFISVCAFGGALLGSWLVTWQAIKAEKLGHPLPADWTWTSIIATDIFFFFLAAALCWEPLTQLLTVFTSEGIERPGLRERTFVRWEDVTDVFTSFPMGRLYLIELRTPTQKIVINALFYKDENELISLIKQHAPNYALLQ